MNRLARLVAKLRPTPFDPPPTRLPLLKFSADKLDSWQLQTDAPIGGFSEAALSPLPGVEGRALWSGVTSLDADRLVQQKYRRSDQKAVASKVGFAAMTKANVELTEADASFAVRKGGPNKASNQNKTAADKVEQKGDR